MFDLKSNLGKGVMAATVALAMSLAGIGGLGGVAEAKSKKKSAKVSQKASSKASQKNSIKQGNKQANKNSTKQVAGNGGEGGDGPKTTCIAAANGNDTAIGGLLAAVVPIHSTERSGNQACGNEVEKDGNGQVCKPGDAYPGSSSTTGDGYGGGYDGCNDNDDESSDGGAGGDNKNVTYQGNYAKNSADYSQTGNSANSVSANAAQTTNG